MLRFVVTGGLALALSGGVTGLAAPTPAAAAHHEPVIQVVTVHVKPGMAERYRQEVGKLSGAMARLGGSGRIRMWQTMVGGPDAGDTLVGVEYPNAAAWAADSPKIQADAEWQNIVAGLDDLRTLESVSIWRDISPNAVQAMSPGSGVLHITGVQVKPGKLETYRERVGASQAIIERLELKGQVRMWHAELAGPDTGAVAVGVEYPDLATYVAEQAKLAADPEWQKLLSGLDEIRTLTGRWLYREITP
jgi:hypothetical protein